MTRISDEILSIIALMRIPGQTRHSMILPNSGTEKSITKNLSQDIYNRRYVKDITGYISATDYIYIDTLYVKLQNRKTHLKDDELVTYNKECLELAENALTRIPWKNYI